MESVPIETEEYILPDDIEEFKKTEYAKRLEATGVILSYICPLMYMNNPLAGKMPVITCSNKLRTYTTARYYREDEILAKNICFYFDIIFDLFVFPYNHPILYMICYH